MTKARTIIDVNLTAEGVYAAIREGVYDAIWHLATSGTVMPCADFYDAIKRGVAEALKHKDISA